MADVINRNTMEIHWSVNTPDHQEPEFMIINGKTFPICEIKYWKIVDDEIAEMSIEEKAVIDYIEPGPEPEPLTIEELEKERDKNIADEIALKYSSADEIAFLRKLITGESELIDVDIMKWLEVIAIAKANYPKVQL